MTIGIVNDVAAVAELMKRVVGLEPGHRVAWIALTGAEAIEFCARDTPDLILMGMMTPAMDGVEITRRIMASTPCAILVVTGSIRANASRVFEAMGCGAIDAVDTPALGTGTIAEAGVPLLTKIATIARFVADKRRRQPIEPGASASARRSRTDSLIAIGASAGGPAVLVTILKELPQNFPAAIVIVQHVDERFAASMATWLNDSTALSVRSAVEGDRPTVGEVLLAATSDHLALKTVDRVGYTAYPIEYVYRPSVDVFFHSASDLWVGPIIGVLLTGMGRDGALGLKVLRDRGCHTIAQDEATSAVYGMPKAAAALNAAVEILPAQRIASRLKALVM